MTGDLNCAHQEIDIHDPKGNIRSAGFTQVLANVSSPICDHMSCTHLLLLMSATFITQRALLSPCDGQHSTLTLSYPPPVTTITVAVDWLGKKQMSMSACSLCVQEERDSFGAELLGRAGLIDTWRAQHPGIVGYTYYSYRFNMREKGKGWRLDYFLVRGSTLQQNVFAWIIQQFACHVCL